MRKNNFLFKKETILVLPDDSEIIRNAMNTFPRHPLYKDINKKHREGYIRGAVDIINLIKNLAADKVVSYEMYPLNPEKGKPAAIDKLLDKIIESRQSEKRYKEIVAKEDSYADKVKALEHELSFVTDVDLYMEITRTIDMLEDKICFNEGISK